MAGLAAMASPTGPDTSRLNQTQRQVLADAAERARESSSAARAGLVERVAAFGYTEAELDRALAYFRDEAAVTINFHPDKALAVAEELAEREDASGFDVAVAREGAHVIDALLADGRYRNQFETGLTGGSASAYAGGHRDEWEREIFAGGYHDHELIPEERPKYGAMNALDLPLGAARFYGSSHLVLTDEARARTTFTPENSSRCSRAQVGTAADFQHVLAELPDEELPRVLDVALGRSRVGVNDSNHYIEAQVHGPVDFAKDVAEVVCDVRLKGTTYEAKLHEFAETYDVPLRWELSAPEQRILEWARDAAAASGLDGAALEDAYLETLVAGDGSVAEARVAPMRTMLEALPEGVGAGGRSAVDVLSALRSPGLVPPRELEQLSATLGERLGTDRGELAARVFRRAMPRSTGAEAARADRLEAELARAVRGGADVVDAVVDAVDAYHLDAEGPLRFRGDGLRVEGQVDLTSFEKTGLIPPGSDAAKALRSRLQALSNAQRRERAVVAMLTPGGIGDGAAARAAFRGELTRSQGDLRSALLGCARASGGVDLSAPSFDLALRGVDASERSDLIDGLLEISGQTRAAALERRLERHLDGLVAQGALTPAERAGAQSAYRAATDAGSPPVDGLLAARGALEGTRFGLNGGVRVDDAWFEASEASVYRAATLQDRLQGGVVRLLEGAGHQAAPLLDAHLERLGRGVGFEASYLELYRGMPADVLREQLADPVTRMDWLLGGGGGLSPEGSATWTEIVRERFGMSREDLVWEAMEHHDSTLFHMPMLRVQARRTYDLALAEGASPGAALAAAQQALAYIPGPWGTSAAGMRDLARLGLITEGEATDLAYRADVQSTRFASGCERLAALVLGDSAAAGEIATAVQAVADAPGADAEQALEALLVRLEGRGAGSADAFGSLSRFEAALAAVPAGRRATFASRLLVVAGGTREAAIARVLEEVSGPPLRLPLSPPSQAAAELRDRLEGGDEPVAAIGVTLERYPMLTATGAERLAQTLRRRGLISEPQAAGLGARAPRP
jgi:hypothetical protein